MPRDTFDHPLFDGTFVRDIPSDTSSDVLNAKITKAEALKSQQYQADAAKKTAANNFAYTPQKVGDRIYTGEGYFPDTPEGHVAALQSHASVHGPVTQGGKIFSGSTVYDDTPSNHTKAGLDYATGGGLSNLPDWVTGASGNNPNSAVDIGARVFSDAYTGTGNAILGGYNAFRQSPLVPGHETFQPIQEMGPALRESLGAKELPPDAPAWQRIAEGGASAALNPIGGAIKLVRGAVSEAPTVASMLKNAAGAGVGTATSYLGGLGLDKLAGDYIGHPLARFVGGAAGAAAPSAVATVANKVFPEPTGPQGAPAAKYVDEQGQPREPTTYEKNWDTLKDYVGQGVGAGLGGWLGSHFGAEAGQALGGGGVGAFVGSKAMPLIHSVGGIVGAQPWYGDLANLTSNVYRSLTPDAAGSVAPAMAQPAQQPPQQPRPFSSVGPAPQPDPPNWSWPAP